MARRLIGTTLDEKLRMNSEVDGQCLRWRRARTAKGYGLISHAGRLQQVHRLAYELWVGPIPAGLEIDHICRVRDCLRADHMEAVTHAENLRRANAAKTHCVQGHLLTASNIKWTNRRGSRLRRCRICYNDGRRSYRAAKRAAIKAVA